MLEEDTFCIFSDKKMQIFSSKTDQLQLINDKSFDKSKVYKNETYFNSEIIAVENVRKAGQQTQKNYLYYDRSSKSIGKVDCIDTAVFKISTKQLRESFETLVVNICSHYTVQQKGYSSLYFYYSNQENLGTYKTLTDINSNEGDKVLHRNNFFMRMNLDNKDLMQCGIVTPYNGFITTHMTQINETVLACSIDYLG